MCKLNLGGIKRIHVDRENRVSVTVIKILCWMCRKTRHDKIRNDNITKRVLMTILQREF